MNQYYRFLTAGISVRNMRNHVAYKQTIIILHYKYTIFRRRDRVQAPAPTSADSRRPPRRQPCTLHAPRRHYPSYVFDFDGTRSLLSLLPPPPPSLSPLFLPHINLSLFSHIVFIQFITCIIIFHSYCFYTRLISKYSLSLRA